ncbi:hypothetical protein T459_27238 [Capsicum annuum]|uniref:AP2/ERF domain-containing protein n=1 Tax=Capsicum annuum TaxID=4072 RepID=A0A2G2YDW7_CAPAN|nr:hypothetical protein T459_27238 [Capsicum annuum]
MKSHKRISKNTYVKSYPIRVRKRKNGKFCAEIKHPFNKKMIWLGTFVTVEDASKSYESKNLEFEELVLAKSAKMARFSKNLIKNLVLLIKLKKNQSRVTDEIEENSSMSADENTNSSDGVEEKINLFLEEESDQELMMGIWVKISED